MKFAAAIAAISAAANAVGAVTVAERRDSWTKFKSSDIESWALRAWGPQESLNTDAHLILLDHTIDGKDQITRQKRLGKKVLCYISAGTVENWRADSKQAQQEITMANKYKGYESTETWVNVLKWESAKGVMSQRINAAAAAGCDGVEFDNLDCYDFASGCVPGSTKAELMPKSMEYITWLTNYAHSKGLGVALKNVNGLASKYPKIFELGDMAIEEANPASEWKNFNGFTSRNKLVLGVQYHNMGGQVCSHAVKNDHLVKYQQGSSWRDCF